MDYRNDSFYLAKSQAHFHELPKGLINGRCLYLKTEIP